MPLPRSPPAAARRLRRGLAGAAAAAALAAIVGTAVWGLAEPRGEAALKAAPAQQAMPKRAAAAAGEPAVTLDKAAEQADGIVVVKVADRPHRRELRAYGTVVDLQSLTDLDNRFENAKAQLDIAQAKLAASQTAYERARSLFASSKVISAAQYQSAQASYLVDRATLEGARSQLRSLAASAVQGWGLVLGRAVIDAKPIMQRLVTRQLVLLQATLPAGERLTGPPSGAVASTGEERPIALDFVSDAPKTDPRLQGLSFYFTAPAASGLLPGMNVVVFIPNGPATAGAVLPENAVVWQDGRAWAYFKTGPGRFVRRPVATGWRAPGGGYIVEGVPNGAEIVSAGAQMLLSEQLRARQAADGGGGEDADDD